MSEPAIIQLQCLLGMQCKGFTIIAADQTTTMSVFVLKNDENKIYELTDTLMIGVIGNKGDSMQFVQFVSKNMDLYKMRNQYRLGTASCVHFIRKNMVDNLREGTPAIINMLVAGYDDKDGAQLYAVEFLGSCMRVPYAVHGLGGLLAHSIMDEYYHPNLSEPQAYEVLKLCVKEIHQRLFYGLENFQVKSISATGIRHLPTISPAALL